MGFFFVFFSQHDLKSFSAQCGSLVVVCFNGFKTWNMSLTITTNRNLFFLSCSSHSLSVKFCLTHVRHSSFTAFSIILGQLSCYQLLISLSFLHEVALNSGKQTDYYSGFFSRDKPIYCFNITSALWSWHLLNVVPIDFLIIINYRFWTGLEAQRKGRITLTL